MNKEQVMKQNISIFLIMILLAGCSSEKPQINNSSIPEIKQEDIYKDVFLPEESVKEEIPTPQTETVSTGNNPAITVNPTQNSSEIAETTEPPATKPAPKPGENNNTLTEVTPTEIALPESANNNVEQKIVYDDIAVPAAEVPATIPATPAEEKEPIQQARQANAENNYQKGFVILRDAVIKDDFININLRVALAEQYFELFERDLFPENADMKEILGNLLFHIRDIYNHSETNTGKNLRPTVIELQKRLQKLSEKAKGKLARAFEELRTALANSPATASAIPQVTEPEDSRVSFSRLEAAARKAFHTYPQVPGACYKTSVLTANKNGISGDGNVWPSSKKYQHSSMSRLKEAITAGDLKAGMIIYVNYNPGTDPMSMNLANGPHWFTYLGKDGSGVDRYSDQYSVSWTLEGEMGLVPGRKIDEILDPYRR
jgi:hypothetical protein